MLKTIFILIIITKCIFSQFYYNGFNYDKSIDNVLTLKPIPTVSKGNIAQIIVSELISYNEAFKYCYYLERGFFEIILNEKSFNLIIYEDSKRKTKIDVIVFLEISTTYKDNANNELTTISDYVMQDREKYVDEKKLDIVLNKLLNDGGATNISNSLPNFDIKWKHRILWDQEILSNLGNGVTGRVMNRSKMRQYMKTPNNQPADLLNDLIDAVIVPHDAYGVHAKLFMLDRTWNRIVYCDKDFNPPFGQARFKSYGSYGTSNNQFKNATGITYGTKVGNRYPLYICDYVNNRITSVDYDLGTFVIEPNTFRTVYNIDKPYDIALHEGLNKTWEQDDYLWYTTEENPKKLRCRSAYGNYNMHEITSYNIGGVTYQLKPGRLDVYSGWWNNMPVRAILAVIDENINAVVYFRLDENGLLPSNTPAAFWVEKFPTSFPINSVKLATTATPWNDPVASVVSSNDVQGNGYLHISKVLYRPHVPYVEVPVAVLYLGSYWVSFLGKYNSSDTIGYPTYKNLIETEVQDGFMDIFTMENWNDSYGVRRLKAGADILSYSLGDYCRDWNSLNFSIRTTNSVYLKFEVRATRQNNQIYNAKILKINGSDEGLFDNGSYYMGLIPSYNSYFNIQLDQTNLPTDIIAMWLDVKVVPGGNPEYLVYPGTGYVINFYPAGGYRVQCATGGGCPFVFITNEQSLQLDNNILHKSEFSDNLNIDITDKYLLNVQPTFSILDSTCSFQFQELNNDYSFFDKVKLIAVDHPQGTKLGITENNDLVLYIPDFVQSPEYAILNDSINVTKELHYDTTGNIYGDSSDIFNSSFNWSSSNKNDFLKATLFVFNKIDMMKNKKRGFFNSSYNYGDSIAVIIDPSNNDNIPPNPNPVKDYAGALIAFSTTEDYNSGNKLFSKRVNKNTTIVPVGKAENIDSVIITWNDSYDLSYIGILPLYYSGFIDNELNLVSAYNSIAGDMTNNVLSNDNIYAELDNQSIMTLTFKNTTNILPVNWIRDYVIIIDGRYLNVQENGRILGVKQQNNIPGLFKLYQNYPNPFNPFTKIKYAVPKKVKVLLQIYDILGREVKTLVNEIKEIGYHEVSFNASNFASGVYFYRIEAGDFVESKKMVVLK